MLTEVISLKHETVKILEKEPETRTDQECKDLLPLVFDLPFMKEYIKTFNEAECRQVANAIRIRKFGKDKRIFCAGDKADDFFVIVRGQVCILYPKPQVYDYIRGKTFNENVLGIRQKYVADAIKA